MEQFQITLNKNQMFILQDALIQLPYGRVAQLIAEINQQLVSQTPPIEVKSD